MEKKFNVEEYSSFWIEFGYVSDEDIIAEEAGFETLSDYYRFVDDLNYNTMFEEDGGIYFKEREECQDLADRLNERISNETGFEEGDIVKFEGRGKKYKVLKVMEERDAAGENVLIQRLNYKGYYITCNIDDLTKVKPKEGLEKGDKFKVGIAVFEVLYRDEDAEEIQYYVKQINTNIRNIVKATSIDEVL